MSRTLINLNVRLLDVSDFDKLECQALGCLGL